MGVEVLIRIENKSAILVHRPDYVFSRMLGVPPGIPVGCRCGNVTQLDHLDGITALVVKRHCLFADSSERSRDCAWISSCEPEDLPRNRLLQWAGIVQFAEFCTNPDQRRFSGEIADFERIEFPIIEIIGLEESSYSKNQSAMILKSSRRCWRG